MNGFQPKATERRAKSVKVKEYQLSIVDLFLFQVNQKTNIIA